MGYFSDFCRYHKWNLFYPDFQSGVPAAYDVLDLFRVSDMDVPDIVFRWLYAWFVLDLPHQYGISAACSVLWAWALFP